MRQNQRCYQGIKLLTHVKCYMGLPPHTREECEKLHAAKLGSSASYRDYEDQDGMSVARGQIVIDDAQKEMSKKLKRVGTCTGKAKLGYRGGYDIAPRYWFNDYEFWWAYQEGCRHWNAFGTGRNVGNGTLKITCEINFPIANRQGNIAGGFVRENGDHLHVVHSGRLGGNYGGRARDFRGCTEHRLDWRSCTWYNGWQEKMVAFVSPLDDGDLVANIAEFVHLVDEFKAGS